MSVLPPTSSRHHNTGGKRYDATILSAETNYPSNNRGCIPSFEIDILLLYLVGHKKRLLIPELVVAPAIPSQIIVGNLNTKTTRCCGFSFGTTGKQTGAGKKSHITDAS